MNNKTKKSHWISFSHKKSAIKTQHLFKLLSIHELNESFKQVQPKRKAKHRNGVDTINNRQSITIHSLSASPTRLKTNLNKQTKHVSKILHLADNIESNKYKENMCINTRGSLKNLQIEMECDILRKDSVRVLPKMSTKNGINNFLIRNNNNETEPDEIIKSSMNKNTITENFFTIQHEKRRTKVIQLSNEFNLRKLPTSFYYFGKVLKESKRLSKPPKQQQHHQLETVEKMSDSEKEYRKVKERFAKISKQQNDEKALIYANLVFKNRITDDNKQSNNTTMKVLRNNLNNIIYLRNILKTKVSLLTEEEEIGIGAIKDMKKSNKEEEYNTSRVLKNCPPNFIKNKLKTKTHRRFQSVEGKYFGVVC